MNILRVNRDSVVIYSKLIVLPNLFFYPVINAMGTVNIIYFYKCQLFSEL